MEQTALPDAWRLAPESCGASRRPDWPARLAAYVEATRGAPFAWGSMDCCLWACGAVEAITGCDPSFAEATENRPAIVLRGSYRDAAGARAVVRRHGGLRELVGEIARRLGYEKLQHSRAGRGDLVLARATYPGWDFRLGICMGPHGLFKAPRGLAAVPLHELVAAWQV